MTAVYPAVSPRGPAWLIVAEMHENRIAACGETEAAAWWRAVVIWGRVFKGTKASAEEWLHRESEVG
jgi:hypothetical protein